MIVLPFTLSAAILFSLFITGCNGGNTADSDFAGVKVTASGSSGRTNVPVVLEPKADGTDVTGCDYFKVDFSNASEGYIITDYSGTSEKAKFQITGNDSVTYTYNINLDAQTVIPLSAGDGTYNLMLFESIGGGQYANNFSDVITVKIENIYGPFLYPNQYVNFNKDSQAVIKSGEIVSQATCDLEAIGKVYGFVAENVVYDTEEAENVETTYLPDVDEVLATGKGICFDYASLMASMLRSQGIPTRLEIGYSNDAYHAWVSVFTKDEGWIGGIIQFDGKSWTLMDPTLAANKKDIKKIKNYIGDGTGYTTKYMY